MKEEWPSRGSWVLCNHTHQLKSCSEPGGQLGRAVNATNRQPAPIECLPAAGHGAKHLMSHVLPLLPVSSSHDCFHTMALRVGTISPISR